MSILSRHLPSVAMAFGLGCTSTGASLVPEADASVLADEGASDESVDTLSDSDAEAATEDGSKVDSNAVVGEAGPDADDASDTLDSLMMETEAVDSGDTADASDADSDPEFDAVDAETAVDSADADAFAVGYCRSAKGPGWSVGCGAGSTCSVHAGGGGPTCRSGSPSGKNCGVIYCDTGCSCADSAASICGCL